MAETADVPLLRVTLCASLQPGQAQEWPLLLPHGACLADALAAAGWLPEAGGPQPASGAALAASGMPPDWAFGIWGRSAGLDALLADGDRVECCRPLTVDPKVARRQRFARQGARTAGLFASRRAGGKAGY